MTPDLILKGTVCYSRSQTELVVRPGAYVVCAEGRSQGVYETLPPEWRDLPVTDFGDQLILPGLIDLHAHAPQYPYRGTGMDLELLDWLQTYAFPEEAKYRDLAYAETAYRQFVTDLTRSATTRACLFATRHRAATTLLMDLLEESGLVTYVGKVNMDRDAPEDLREPSAQASIRETRRWLDETADRYQRTRPILTPRFLPSCTDPLLDALGQLQQERDLPVQSHLSENPAEIQLVRQLAPQSKHYGDAYDRMGLLGRNARGDHFPTIMAHCVWSSPEEVALLKANGVFVAHCPASNTNVASGIAPVRSYLKAGLSLGLGSDVSGGHTLSLFRAMTDAIQVSKLYWRLVDETAAPLTFPEAFYLATKGGGAFFGQVGSFEPGYEFDAVVLDDSRLPTTLSLDGPQRLERAAYLSLDLLGLTAKYVAGHRLF